MEKAAAAEVGIISDWKLTSSRSARLLSKMVNDICRKRRGALDESRFRML